MPRSKLLRTFQDQLDIILSRKIRTASACHKYEESGLEAVEPKDYFHNQKSYKFAPLHQRLLVKVKLQVSSNYAIVPFDMYFPSLDEELAKSICKKCGAY